MHKALMPVGEGGSQQDPAQQRHPSPAPPQRPQTQPPTYISGSNSRTQHQPTTSSVLCCLTLALHVFVLNLGGQVEPAGRRQHTQHRRQHTQHQQQPQEPWPCPVPANRVCLLPPPAPSTNHSRSMLRQTSTLFAHLRCPMSLILYSTITGRSRAMLRVTVPGVAPTETRHSTA